MIVRTTHAGIAPGYKVLSAAGLPVVAYGAGGVRDSVLDGRTGVLYEPGGVEELCAAIERFEALRMDNAELRANARRFAPERFALAFGQLLASLPAAADSGR